IAILAAMLFPVFAKARDKARQASCSSNLRQITMGFLMYAQDYDEILPRGAGYVAPQTIIDTAGEWFITLAPYIKNTQVFNCPSQPYTVFYSGGGSSSALGYGVSYSRNLWIWQLPLAQAKEPAVTVGYMDGGNNNYHRLPCPSLTNCGGGTYGWAYTRHNDGCNYTFLDGHAKWSKEDGSANGRARPDFHFCINYHG
ncbi:MAG: DUF1559 domain-containing protein, partial [Armatimonadetes bacterium]|nr:DUF1559 domain-containing protein [Armatimonadota bacterium]